MVQNRSFVELPDTIDVFGRDVFMGGGSDGPVDGTVQGPVVQLTQ
jgi:hypothetical protein